MRTPTADSEFQIGMQVIVTSGYFRGAKTIHSIVRVTAKYVEVDGFLYAKDGGKRRGDTGFYNFHIYFGDQEEIERIGREQEVRRMRAHIRAIAEKVYSMEEKVIEKIYKALDHVGAFNRPKSKEKA